MKIGMGNMDYPMCLAIELIDVETPRSKICRFRISQLVG
jgi:hypothetical protein